MRHAQPTQRGEWVRFGLRGVGQTLITAGLVVLLFVVYELWVTNIFAHAKQVKVHDQLAEQWRKGEDPLVPNPNKLALPGAKGSTIPIGSGIANIYIPRLGSDYHFTIVEGTDDASLEKGPGHYLNTQLPGQVGNFAIAGHRVGKGEPFLNLDQLKPGDAMVIETEHTWFIYRVKGNVHTGDLSDGGSDQVPGREIVDPSDGNVILPVPDHPGQQATEKLITLTTCHPKFEANQRMILHGVLARQVPRSGSVVPKEMQGGTV
jgi:sortase A